MKNTEISKIFILLHLLFGIVAIAFSVIWETQYTIISIIIAAVMIYFNKLSLLTGKSEGNKIKNHDLMILLSKMVTLIIAPMVLLIVVSKGDFWAILIGTVYTIAAIVRMAMLEREYDTVNWDEDEANKGVPLFSIAILLPVLSLICWILPDSARLIIWNLSYLLMSGSFVMPYSIPKIPSNFQYGLLALGLLAIAALLLQGPMI